MKFGRTNIITGAIVIFIATAGGFLLGGSLEPNFTDGFYKMSHSRALMKAGHTHGMLFAYFNLIVGLLLAKLELADNLKQWLSRMAIGALLVPIGVFTRGLLGGTEAVMPVVALGAICYLGAAALILKGALAIKTDH
ncbi:MAG: hypothetical protein OEV92_09285 [Nitrospinota bacterium]|nr:hypothetical protein [Nitrospinota bacterium]